MFFLITQLDYNTIGIFILLLVIIYYVSGFQKRVSGLSKGSSAHYYLNTTARIKALDYAPQGVVTVDSEGYVVSWSGGAEAIFGYTEGEMIHKPLRTVIPVDSQEEHIKAITKERDSGYSKIIGKTLEVFGVTKKGVKLPIQLTLWRWNEGSNVYYTGILRDITEKKKKETEVNQFLLMHERGEDIDNSGVWSWDVLTDTVYVSEGFKRIFDVDKNVTDSGFLLKRVYHEDLKKVEAAIKKAFDDKQGYKIQYRLVRTNGEVAKVEINACTYFDEKGELTNITGTIHTI